MSVSIKSPTATTGAIQLNASDVLTIDSSGNLTAPNNLTVNGNLVTDTNTFYVDATNNSVGIGTTSPTSYLTGKLAVVSASDNYMNLVAGSANASGYMLQDTTGTSIVAGTRYTHSDNGLGFWGNGAERMHIDSNGYVGINGAANNRAQLEVKAGNSTIHQLFLEQDNTEHGWQFYADRADGGLAFYRRDNSGLAERVRIDTSGSVTIGTANATSGGTKYIAGGTNWYWNNWVTSTATKNQFTFNNPNGEVGRITTNGTATAYNTSSDYRLKENVAPMSGSIDRLKQLKPSTWSWVQDGSHGEGFLAHEAQAVVPEAVTGTKDAVDDEGNPVYQGIDQAKLVPLLTAALQEAITKIEDLETRIQALENPNG